MNAISRIGLSLLVGLALVCPVVASPGVGGGSTVGYNPGVYVAQGVVAPNGGTYPQDSYQLLITGPSAASSTNVVTVTLGFSVLNAPAGVTNALNFISASQTTLTFNTANQVVPVTIIVSVPQGTPAGNFSWLIKPLSWPAAANVATDNGATVNGLAAAPPAPILPPVITNVSPVNGTNYIYTTTPIAIPISFDATATPDAPINVMSATIDGVPFNGTAGFLGGILQALTTVITNTVTASTGHSSATTPGFTGAVSGPHTIVVSATNKGGTTTATTQINILAPPAITSVNNTSFTYGQAGTFSVTASGFPAPTFSVTSGTLPAGVTLNPTTGVLSGTPAAAGSFVFTITATNSVGVANQSFTLTVNKVALTVTAVAASKIYGSADPALSYALTTGALVGTDTLTGTLVRVAGESVGTYAIAQGSLAASANYTLTYVGANFTVVAKPITVTAAAVTKVFGAADPALTYSITSGALVGTDKLTGALVRAAGENVGTYAIAKGTLAATANYTLTFVGANFTITKANQTIAFAALASKAVGAAPFALTATASSGLAVTYTSSNPAVATVSGSTVTILSAGSTTITASQAGNANYNAAPSVAQILTVTGAPPPPPCVTTILWLPPISLGKVQHGGSVIPIKFLLQQCCPSTPGGHQGDGDDDDDDSRDDDGSWSCSHGWHGDDGSGDDNGWGDDNGRCNDFSGQSVDCHHGQDGKSTDNRSCHHDCSHEQEDDSGCANLRDQTVVISIYEVGSNVPATTYPYGPGSPNPPDYSIDGDYQYQLNFTTARGTHVYHIDVYRYPPGATAPVLVGSKEFKTS